jgi:hypothetical protein
MFVPKLRGASTATEIVRFIGESERDTFGGALRDPVGGSHA